MIYPVYISSSNIDSIGYGDLGTLYIRFKSGSSYAYADVPYTIFDALQKVESAGRFFNKMIKDKFKHTHGSRLTPFERQEVRERSRA